MLLFGLLLSLLVAAAAPPDTLVVCSRELQEELAPWVTHRTNQGHEIQVIEPAETLDELRTAVQAANAGGALQNVLLVGDMVVAGEREHVSIPVELAAAKINVRYGSKPELATDYGLSDLDGDQQPDLCVGRLPVQTREELAQVVQKIIAYENDRRGADWRRRVNLVAGTGRFSFLADRVIETTAGKLVSEMVPADRVVNFTYGSWRSPFCPPPRRFSQHTLASLNQGCQLWIYVGHGEPDRLDDVYMAAQRYPMLTSADLGRLECQAGRPIAVLLACYTGAFDEPQRCVAEQFLLQPGGPVAVLAASRVSMPYGNTVLGAELMRSVFAEQAPTLGKAVRRAKRRVLERQSNDPHRKMVENIAALFTPSQIDRDQERWEHVQMYNLLGDPLLRISHPGQLQFTAANQVVAGSTVRVQGRSPYAGELRCEWALSHEQRLASGAIRRIPRFDAAGEEEQALQYKAANRSVLAASTLAVDKGQFEGHVPVPPLQPGRYVLRALLAEEAGWASAAVSIEIVSAEASQPVGLVPPPAG